MLSSSVWPRTSGLGWSTTNIYHLYLVVRESKRIGGGRRKRDGWVVSFSETLLGIPSVSDLFYEWEVFCSNDWERDGVRRCSRNWWTPRVYSGLGSQQSHWRVRSARRTSYQEMEETDLLGWRGNSESSSVEIILRGVRGGTCFWGGETRCGRVLMNLWLWVGWTKIDKYMNGGVNL